MKYKENFPSFSNMMFKHVCKQVMTQYYELHSSGLAHVHKCRYVDGKEESSVCSVACKIQIHDESVTWILSYLQ